MNNFILGAIILITVLSIYYYFNIYIEDTIANAKAEQSLLETQARKLSEEAIKAKALADQKIAISNAVAEQVKKGNASMAEALAAKEIALNAIKQQELAAALARQATECAASQKRAVDQAIVARDAANLAAKRIEIANAVSAQVAKGEAEKTAALNAQSVALTAIRNQAVQQALSEQLVISVKLQKQAVDDAILKYKAIAAADKDLAIKQTIADQQTICNKSIDETIVKYKTFCASNLSAQAASAAADKGLAIKQTIANQQNICANLQKQAVDSALKLQAETFLQEKTSYMTLGDAQKQAVITQASRAAETAKIAVSALTAKEAQIAANQATQAAKDAAAAAKAAMTTGTIGNSNQTIMIRSNATNNCIARQAGGNLQTGGNCSYTPWQLWEIIPNNGSQAIRHNHTKQCLFADPYNNTISFQDCNNLNLLGGLWNVVPNGSDAQLQSYGRTNSLGNTMCLSNSGMKACNSNDITSKYKISQQLPYGTWGYWYNNLGLK